MQNHTRALAGLAGFPTSLQLARDEIGRRQANLEELRAKHAAASQVPGMMGHPGFKTFLGEIAKMRDLAISRLLSADPETASMLAQRERAVAFDEILELVQRHEKIAADLVDRIRSEEQALS